MPIFDKAMWLSAEMTGPWRRLRADTNICMKDAPIHRQINLVAALLRHLG